MVTSMAKRGHKEDCECAICKAIRTRAERERTETDNVLVAAPLEGIIIGSLMIGQIFRYENRMYRKLNDLGPSSMIEDLQTTEAEQMPNNRVVVPIARGHEVEKEE